MNSPGALQGREAPPRETGLRLPGGLASSLPRGQMEPAAGFFQIVPRINPGVRALSNKAKKKKKNPPKEKQNPRKPDSVSRVV